MIGVVFICCTFVAKIKYHSTNHKKLRSSTNGKLPIPVKCNLTKTLNCCFTQVAPRLWNNLPQGFKMC